MNRNAHTTRWPIVLLLSLLLALSQGLTGAAQAQTEPTAITLLQSEAQVSFPDQMRFTLSAESSAAPITSVELLYGAARLDGLTIIPIEISPAQRIDTEHEINTQVYYFPPGADLTYRWMIEDANGNRLETPPQQVAYHDDRFDWQERSFGQVTIYWYEGDQTFGDALVQVTEQSLQQLEQDIGATVQDPIKIYVYASSDAMRSALRSNSAEWIGGQAWPALGLILGHIRPGNVVEIERLIPHELSHQVLHQATDNPYGGVPLWFNEGLAVYNQGIVDAEFPLMVNEAASSGELIPLEALAANFPADPQQARLSYAQSHSVVAYMIDTYGPEAMSELVNDFGAAMPTDTALEETIGLSVDELDTAWRESIGAAEIAPLPEDLGPVAAPPDRFAGAPILPPPDTVDIPPAEIVPEPTAEPAPSLIPGVPLPQWAELALLTSGCLVILVILASGVFIAARLSQRAE
ncbi:MAG: hypothetical protein HC837_05660 [Chloroflexaceae bacterium]|nr:hypothetical protein [Chloroflexaceae bacterium]